VPRPTRGPRGLLPVRGCHPLWPGVPAGSGSGLAAAGLVRVRSPLLTESRLMSFPPGTEMFQFPGFASPAYRFGRRYPIAGVGCPIRRSPDRSPLAAPRGLSQRATSFVASWRQGIHQMPFLSLDPAQRQPRPRGAPPPPEGDRAATHIRTTPQAYPCRNPPRPKTERPKKRARRDTLASARPHAARGGKGGLVAPFSLPAPADGHSLSPPYDVQRTDGTAPRPPPPA
jgi:hypothetical protein